MLLFYQKQPTFSVPSMNSYIQYELSETQWDQIKDALPGQSHHRGRTAENNRLFVEAVLWMGRNGGRWRSLPYYSQV
jgi:hypothetical protein